MRKGAYYCNITLFKDTGMVVRCVCECKVGAVGHCAHVGGVRLHNPCTSSLCGWNTPPERDIEPQCLCDINWWPGKADPDKPWPYVYKAGPCEQNEDHAKTFREDILDGLETANPDCILYVHLRRSKTNLSEFIDMFTCPIILDDTTDLNSDFAQDLFQDFVEDLMEKCTKDNLVTLSSLVEKGTCGQSFNLWWKQIRCILLTASNFGRIISIRESTLPDKFLEYLCGYKDVPRARAILHGVRSEPKARKIYMKPHKEPCASQ